MRQYAIPPQVSRFRFTVEHFHRMAETGIFNEDSRIELIEGELIQMSPIGSLPAAIVSDLTRRLIMALKESAVVYVQSPVMLGEQSEPQPDLALLHPRQDRYRNSLPRASDVLLLIEVADSSLQYDRTVKIPLYARHAIPEVWLVDIKNRLVEVYHGAEEGLYRHIDSYRKGSLSSRQLPGVAIDLAELF